MNHFTEALGLSRYTLTCRITVAPWVFAWLWPIRYRIEALIVQNAVAHNEGLGAIWKTRRAFWADRAVNESALRANLLSLATTRTHHVGSDPYVERYAPDLWTDEFAFLSQPGQVDIQSDLFYDYRTNVDSYPKWQAWMRERQTWKAGTESTAAYARSLRQVIRAPAGKRLPLLISFRSAGPTCRYTCLISQVRQMQI